MCSVGLGWPKVTLKARGVGPPGWGERASIRAKMECAGMLLVGRDVSVRLCLGGLPRRWGVRRVWDRGNGVGQGQRSSHNTLHSCPGSRQPARCYTNQPRREPTTERDGQFLLSQTTCWHTVGHLIAVGTEVWSPIGCSAVEFRVHGGGLHRRPLRGCHQILLIHTVLQTVRDTTCTDTREHGPWMKASHQRHRLCHS